MTRPNPKAMPSAPDKKFHGETCSSEDAFCPVGDCCLRTFDWERQGSGSYVFWSSLRVRTLAEPDASLVQLLKCPDGRCIARGSWDEFKALHVPKRTARSGPIQERKLL